MCMECVKNIEINEDNYIVDKSGGFIFDGVLNEPEEENEFELALKASKILNIELLKIPEDEKKKNKCPFDYIGIKTGNITIVGVCKEKVLIEKNTGRKDWNYICYCNCSPNEPFLRNRHSLFKSIKNNRGYCPNCGRRDLKENFSLIGRKFSKLKVISEAPTKNHKRRWYCECSCGNPEYVIVNTSDLIAGITKSCGCLRFETKNTGKKYKIGDIINEWEILKIFSLNNIDYIKVRCRCCKEEKEIRYERVTKTYCLKREEDFKKILEEKRKTLEISPLPDSKFQDLTGKKFGKLKVLGFSCKIKDGLYWVCECNCQNKTKKVIRGSRLTGLEIFDCGCENMSYGEKRIKNFLENNNVKFISQKSFIDCRNKLPLHYDFQVFYLNSDKWFLLEFQGIQHYVPTRFSKKLDR